MEFVRLRIENFMSIGDADLCLSEKGLVLIQGVNTDDTSAKSNGAGKSTIPDALSWCVYGETARGESGDAIINRTVGKGTAVTVTIQNGGGEVFTVARHRKHKKQKNRLVVHRWPDLETAIKDDFDAATELTLGTDKLTQEIVAKVVGCSAEVFNAAIYSGQERMPNLPGMTDKQLKELVEEAAGVTVLQEAYVEARERFVKADATVRTATMQTASVENALITQQETESRLKSDASLWAAAQKMEIERCQAALDATHATELAYLAQLPAKKDELAKAIERRDWLSAQIQSASSEKRSLKAFEDAVHAIDRKIAGDKSRLQMILADAKRREAAIKSINDRVGQPCNECGKPIETGDVAAAVVAQKRDLTAVVTQFRALKEVVTASESELTAAKGERDAYAATMTDTSVAMRDWSVATNEVSTFTSWIKQGDSITAKLKVESEALTRETTRENPHAAHLARMATVIARCKTAVATETAALAAANENMALVKQAVEVFGPAGVRAHIIDNVTPFLNARTSHYLNVLADENIKAIWSTVEINAKGEVREKFNIDVQSATAGNSFGLLSGGEKRKVRLACALALQDLISTRASQPISLFIADEIDDALDAAGLERLMTILDEKARERGTVLVISHNDLADWIRETTVVTKSGGVSKIDGALVN